MSTNKTEVKQKLISDIPAAAAPSQLTSDRASHLIKAQVIAIVARINRAVEEIRKNSDKKKAVQHFTIGGEKCTDENIVFAAPVRPLPKDNVPVHNAHAGTGITIYMDLGREDCYRRESGVFVETMAALIDHFEAAGWWSVICWDRDKYNGELDKSLSSYDVGEGESVNLVDYSFAITLVDLPGATTKGNMGLTCGLMPYGSLGRDGGGYTTYFGANHLPRAEALYQKAAGKEVLQLDV